MKKIILLIVFLFSISFSYSYVEEFEIELDPESPRVNESVDLTVRAVDDQGEVVQDYNGDILMMVENAGMDDVSFPSDGIYTFSDEDQGEVVFDRGLEFHDTSDITDEGYFDLVVEDMFDEDVYGKLEVEVFSEEDDQEWDIDILSPSEGDEYYDDSLEVIGQTDAPNTQFDIYLNGNLVESGTTDSDGGFDTNIDGLTDGENEVYVSLMDGGDTMAESDTITFYYEEQELEDFKDIIITPEEGIKEGETVTVQVETGEDIEDVQLTIDGVGEYSMNNVEDGFFEVDATIDEVGTFPVHVETIYQGESANFEEVDSVSVSQEGSISSFRYEQYPEEDEMYFSWNYDGKYVEFKLVYADSQDNLNDKDQREEVIVEDNEVVLEGFDFEEDYYVKVFELDDQQDKTGVYSDVSFVEGGMMGAASCRVRGIELSIEKDGDDHYLVWDEVEGAEKYNVYMSEDGDTTSISDMEKVAETEDTKFKYPFDPDAEEVSYNWYAVEADCEDGERSQIGDVERVQVGPFLNFVMFVLISVFLYLLYNLYVYTRE
ncbi:hypothetical protein [Candidatus Absconditicoccus praedator]|uniref:hypothetical protein n=1 Tax=Candidatus Absconditicoccus praedator TaxID=2735562 RepID=UPI001E457A62|nr:hypothetical protein [Candidatus Absconditicoccus praedator]UFX83201.1 hypothetical protein HLG78_03665 [Candidatus Absconditicoccus praedator]